MENPVRKMLILIPIAMKKHVLTLITLAAVIAAACTRTEAAKPATRERILAVIVSRIYAVKRFITKVGIIPHRPLQGSPILL